MLHSHPHWQLWQYDEQILAMNSAAKLSELEDCLCDETSTSWVNLLWWQDTMVSTWYWPGDTGRRNTDWADTLRCETLVMINIVHCLQSQILWRIWRWWWSHEELLMIVYLQWTATTSWSWAEKSWWWLWQWRVMCWWWSEMMTLITDLVTVPWSPLVSTVSTVLSITSSLSSWPRSVTILQTRSPVLRAVLVSHENSALVLVLTMPGPETVTLVGAETQTGAVSLYSAPSQTRVLEPTSAVLPEQW